jgi:hypothetical protein
MLAVVREWFLLGSWQVDDERTVESSRALHSEVSMVEVGSSLHIDMPASQMLAVLWAHLVKLESICILLLINDLQSV